MLVVRLRFVSAVCLDHIGKEPTTQPSSVIDIEVVVVLLYATGGSVPEIEVEVEVFLVTRVVVDIACNATICIAVFEMRVVCPSLATKRPAGLLYQTRSCAKVHSDTIQANGVVIPAGGESYAVRSGEIDRADGYRRRPCISGCGACGHYVA